MLKSLKRWVKTSPAGPLILSAYRRYRFAEPTRSVVATNHRYDFETVQVMKRLLLPDSCCVDVGAHRGDILWHMVRLAPRGTHYAFEPIPSMAAELRRDFPEVTVIQAAVSDSAGRASFVHVENDPGYSGLRQRPYDRPDPVLTKLDVEVVRIDGVIKGRVDFMKLDIEGGELHALRGATPIIETYRPVLVFEAGQGAAGQYGVDADAIFDFTSGMRYNISTMARWLDGGQPYTRATFAENWREGPDYYFIATPGK